MKTLVLTVALSWPLIGSAGLVKTGGLSIRFSGNLVITDEVYLYTLGLPADAEATSATALAIAQKLTTFLHQTGYELASVSASVENGVIAVAINEGRLEKVVFRGRLTIQALRFKLAFSIPHDVFNRPQLEREIARSQAQYGFHTVWFQLVPTATVTHRGPQIEALPTIGGYRLVHEREPFELHIFFEEKDWDTGPGIDIRAGYIDGFELTPSFQGVNGLVRGDRWRVAASTGLGLRQHIGDYRFYPTPSRESVELSWYAPGTIGNFRPLGRIQGELVDRQRQDLSLERYDALTSEASLNLEGQGIRQFHILFGAGFQWRKIFGLKAASGSAIPSNVIPPDRTRLFAAAMAHRIFNVTDRLDRAHSLKIEAKEYFPLSSTWFGYAAHRYQLVLPFGWHDIWLKSRGKWLWGVVDFHDDEALGEHLYGVYRGDYVRHVGSAAVELRLSVNRDVLKLSGFGSWAIFDEVDRITGARQLGTATAFGPGIHTLIAAMFQLDFYLSFGFRSPGQFDMAASAVLEKVF